MEVKKGTKYLIAVNITKREVLSFWAKTYWDMEDRKEWNRKIVPFKVDLEVKRLLFVGKRLTAMSHLRRKSALTILEAKFYVECLEAK